MCGEPHSLCHLISSESESSSSVLLTSPSLPLQTGPNFFISLRVIRQSPLQPLLPPSHHYLPSVAQLPLGSAGSLCHLDVRSPWLRLHPLRAPLHLDLSPRLLRLHSFLTRIQRGPSALRSCWAPSEHLLYLGQTSPRLSGPPPLRLRRAPPFLRLCLHLQSLQLHLCSPDPHFHLRGSSLLLHRGRLGLWSLSTPSALHLLGGLHLHPHLVLPKMTSHIPTPWHLAVAWVSIRTPLFKAILWILPPSVGPPSGCPSTSKAASCHPRWCHPFGSPSPPPHLLFIGYVMVMFGPFVFLHLLSELVFC